MLEPDKAKIAVGTILKTHGVKGEFNVELTDYAEPEEDFSPGACLIVELDGLDVPFFVETSRPRGSAGILLTLSDVNTEAEAQQLVGKTLSVYVDREDADGLTADEAVGYEIFNADTSASVGRIAEVTELTPGNLYFTLTDGRLIPAVDEFVVAIDHETKRMEMSLPEGLLEL